MPDASDAAPAATDPKPEAPSPPPAPAAKKKAMSLADIPTSATAKRPKPFDLTWVSVGEDGAETPVSVTVALRHPKNDDGTPMDAWAFQVGYYAMMQLAKTPAVGKDGVQSYPNEGRPEAYLREHLVESPEFLHDERQFKEFKAKVPPHVPAQLNLELLLSQGMDNDFFERLSRFTNPTAHLRPAAG